MATADHQRIIRLESDVERGVREHEALQTRMTEFVAYSREQWAGLREREANRDAAIKRIDENCTATRAYTDSELEKRDREDEEHRRINVTQVGIAVAAIAAVASAIIGALSNAGVL